MANAVAFVRATFTVALARMPKRRGDLYGRSCARNVHHIRARMTIYREGDRKGRPYECTVQFM